MGAGTIGHGASALVGRARELSLVSASLERGGCVIVGAAGVGKSRLAQEVAARQEASTLRVVATAAARSIPFGAFGHLPAGVDAGERGPLRAYVELLQERSGGEQPTLLVDDAHLLDDSSAALLLALREAGTARVLATVRDREAVPDAITALWKDDWVDRLDLEPLAPRELRELVEIFLGAPADAAVHTRIQALARGNPLYARELLLDAQRSGALAESGGRWSWTGIPPRMVRLGDLISTRTRDLSASGREALELLALGAPLRLQELVAVAGEDGVVELEGAGLAEVRGNGGSAVIELAHPLFGEVTRAELPAALARRHRRRLLKELTRREITDSPELVRLASLKLDEGHRDPQLFVRAGAYALRVQAGVPGPGWGDGDPSLALRFADAAGAGLEAALLASRGHMALDSYDAVEQRLAPLEGAAARAPFGQAAEYLQTRVCALQWSGTRIDSALALLDRASRWRDDPAWVGVHAVRRAWILLDNCRPLGARQAVEPLLRLDDLAPHARLDALLVLTLALSRLGLTGRCEALESEIVRLADDLERAGWQIGWARYAVDGFARAEAARDLAGTAERLRDGLRRADERGDVPLTAGLGMALGRLELTRGHAAEAEPLLREAVEGLAAGDPRNGLGYALCHLARTLALRGDVTRAGDALARARAVAGDRPSSVRLALEVERARAWTDAAAGRVTAARERVLQVATQAGEALTLAAETTYDALRFGAPPGRCAERLSALAGCADSDLLDVCAAHAGALASEDARGQLRAVQRFAELGLDGLAAEAAMRAATASSHAGEQTLVRRARALAAKHAAASSMAVTVALPLTPASVKLTQREREVAALAARGLSNAAIASELVLSVRTVETYVLRACRKLGVEARTGLAQVLDLSAMA